MWNMDREQLEAINFFVISFYRHAEKGNEVKTKLFSSHVGSRVQVYNMPQYTRLLA